MTILGPNLTGLRGTQITGSISYTLVTLGHTLKSFASIEYEFSVLIKERGRLQKWFEEVSEWFHYITDGSRRVRNHIDDIKKVSE
jgi:hypothetical protein